MSSSVIVLVGAGHAHLYVAARAKNLVERGARVLLIDPGTFWYSGLATGMLGGMYTAAQDQLDPKSLIESRGGEFIADRVTAVDAATQRLSLAGGETLEYDYLSLNVGSQVNAAAIDGIQGDTSVWSVKPVSNLWQLREHLEARFQAGETPRVAVVGGGPTGSEVAANLAALGAQHRADMPVTLVTHSERLIKQAPKGAATRLFRNLTGRGVDVQLNTGIARRENDSLVAEDGRRIAADIVVLAIGLEANPLVTETGLPVHQQAGLRITPTLQSVADPRVFAAGDCASMDGLNLPKLGVFGVRQAEYIYQNLCACLQGNALQAYQPQKRYLAILNLGDGSAIATWGPFWWHGRSSMWLKNTIDQKFMQGYRTQQL